MSISPPVAVRNVWKVFGHQPEKVLSALDAGASKSEVLNATGHVLAVRDVSFTVQPGESFVVMGLSGSGKSTLLRLLPRLIAATRGTIEIDGADVGALDEKGLRELRRHRMSMVFQHFGLLPHRRILENVAYGLEIQGTPKKERLARAKEMLAQVNLAGWEERYPAELSGGMQQRVGLARALAVDPEILLFDEPFSALDPLIRREMQDELLRLQARMKKTIVFITHDFAEAIKLGTHIAIMKDGAFEQVGTPEELVLHPATEYVAEFTRDVPRMRVLTAGSVMTPSTSATVENGTAVSVKRSAPLSSCASVVLSCNGPCTVKDDLGAVVGWISREDVLGVLRSDAATAHATNGELAP